MSKRNFDSSDPLPYSQVDRAVKPKAALLAGHLGVTPQHALGSLVEFWDLCAGDQRDLEAAIAATPAGNEPAILLDGDDVALRFQLASGHKVEPVVLARLGLLEPTGKQYRVRGMSRYFKPLLEREVKRESGAKGGRASAAVRSSTASSSAQAPAQPSAQAPAQADAQPPAQQAVSSQHSADSRQHSAVVTTAQVVQLPRQQAPEPERRHDSGSAYLAFLNAQRIEAGLVPEVMHPAKWDAWFSEALGELNGDGERLDAAVHAFSRDPYWRDRGLPLRGFVSQWRKYVPQVVKRGAS